MRKTALFMAMAATLAAPAAASAFEIGFSWAGTRACSSTPPAFSLKNVPAGTKSISFRMIDLQVPSYPHGGGIVGYSGGGKIPGGAFAYTGPCPPKGEHHTYQWTAKAIDAAGKTLASASAKQTFPPR